jgi:hypothetical protein
MAGHAQAGIDVARIVPMHEAEAAPQTVLVARNGDEMHVIGHEAIGPDLDSRALRPVRQQVEIERIIALLEEGPPTPVPRCVT